MYKTTARRKLRTIRLAIRNVAGALSFCSFIALLGTAGAVEHDNLPLLEGTIRSFGFLLIFAGLFYLAMFFDNLERRDRK